MFCEVELGFIFSHTLLFGCLILKRLLFPPLNYMGTFVKKQLAMQGSLFLNLLEKRLLLDAEQGLTAAEALTNPYLKSLHNTEDELRVLYLSGGVYPCTKYYTVLIIVSLIWSQIVWVLHIFIFNNVLAILDILHFYISLTINLAISIKKKPVGFSFVFYWNYTSIWIELTSQ